MSKLSFLKVYLCLFVLLSVVGLVFILLAIWSIDYTADINRVIEDFGYYKHKLEQVNWFHFILLTILAVIQHLRAGNRWYYLPQTLSFSIFTIGQYFYLNNRFFQYRRDLDILEGGFDTGFLVGTFQIMAAIVTVLFLVFIMTLIRRKLLGLKQ